MNSQSRVCSILTVLVFFSATGAASGQALSRRVEVGAQLSLLRLADVDATNAGVGGRASYDVLPWLTIEGEVSFFSNDRLDLDVSGLGTPGFEITYSRRRVEALVGPKIGLRRDRFGVFAKARPGFARLSDRGLQCLGEMCALVLLARPVYRIEPAMDVGGVFEFYPTARTVARFDLGTTLIRHRSDAPPCDNCTSTNLASSLGFGYRF
jgi:hypothetical protein